MNGNTDTLISGLVDQLEPVRAYRFSRGMAFALFAMIAAPLIVVLLFAVRPDVAAAQPHGIFMLSSGLFLLLGIACAAAVVAMASPRVGSGRNGWGWAVAMAGLLPASALVLMAVEGSTAWQASQPDHGIFCLFFAVLLGMVTALALIPWLRRGAPTSPERAGLLVGIASGAAGVFAFSFACPIDAVMHIGLWHGLPVTSSALIGRFAVPPLIRW